MKMTLLEMVQSIMSDMDSDEVTSISDTVESAQIASTIRDVYYQLITDQTVPEFLQLRALETMNLTDFPSAINYFKIPDDVTIVKWLQYNVQQSGDTTDAYSFLKYRDPIEFIDLVSGTNTSDATAVAITDPDTGLVYHIYNDKAPQF